MADPSCTWCQWFPVLGPDLVNGKRMQFIFPRLVYLLGPGAQMLTKQQAVLILTRKKAGGSFPEFREREPGSRISHLPSKTSSSSKENRTQPWGTCLCE